MTVPDPMTAPGDDAPAPTAPGVAPATIVPASTNKPPGLKAWLPSKVEVLVFVILALAASNIAQWIALEKASDTRPVTVVAVRQMTADYVKKITTASLSERESVMRASLFMAAAQEELGRLVPGDHLVLARECVLSGNMTDITDQLEKAVETKLAHDTAGLSDTAGSVQPGVAEASQRIESAPMSSGDLLSPPASAGGAAQP